MEIESTLAGLGLTEKQVKVYIACLKAGLSTIVRISELTNIPKSTCYDLLRSLISQGLCTSIIKDKTNYFEAENPNILLTNLQEKEKKIKEILPQIQSLKSSAAEKPKVLLYQGKSGLKSIHEDIFKTKKEYLVLGNHTIFSEFYDFFSDQFIKKRVKLRIPCKYIAEDSKIARHEMKRDSQVIRKTKITGLMNNQKAECYIFGNKVVFTVPSKNEPIGIVIENQEIANLQRMLFNQLYSSL